MVEDKEIHGIAGKILWVDLSHGKIEERGLRRRITGSG